MKKIAFLTLGCKVNQYETNGMIQSFKDNGYEIVNFENFADIYVVNTCTVTNMSDRKSRQVLRQARKNNKDAIVIAVGCYAQVAKEELEKIPEIDFVLGTNEKINIVKYVEQYLNQKQSQEFNIEIDDVMQNKEYGDFGSVTYTEKTRAVIKVQDGCDRFCSYCIIPYARGRVRSRKPENVINEIKEIAKTGIKEVVITGIHVASYGKDFKEEYRLIDLLEEINKIDGIERIRLGSIEPLLITEEFVSRLEKLEKICHHFHLSLQSGCTETLKRMNRHYTADEYAKIVEDIRRIFDNPSITTDIMVGFAGESEEEFEKNLAFSDYIGFTKVHVFSYSRRKGTVADKLPMQVDPAVKNLRSKKMIEHTEKKRAEFLNSQIGLIEEVLFEIKNKQGFYEGYTKNYTPVYVKSDAEIIGKIIPVKIIDAKSDYCIGVIQ